MHSNGISFLAALVTPLAALSSTAVGLTAVIAILAGALIWYWASTKKQIRQLRKQSEASAEENKKQASLLEELKNKNANEIERLNKKLHRAFELNKTVALPALEEFVARTRRPVEDADRLLLARQAMLSANVMHALHIIQRPRPVGPPPSVESFALYQAAQEVLTDFNVVQGPEDCYFANEIPREIYVTADRFMIKQAFFSVLQWVNLQLSVNELRPVLQAVAKVEGVAVWTKFYVDYAEEAKIEFEESTVATEALYEFITETVNLFGGLAESRVCPGRAPELLLALPLGEKENADDSFHFTNQEPDQASPLSEADRVIIAPFLSDVEEYEVYELSEIEEILDKIPQQENLEIKKWVVEMRKAIYSCNETAYRELLESVRL